MGSWIYRVDKSLIFRIDLAASRKVSCTYLFSPVWFAQIQALPFLRCHPLNQVPVPLYPVILSPNLSPAHIADTSPKQVPNVVLPRVPLLSFAQVPLPPPTVISSPNLIPALVPDISPTQVPALLLPAVVTIASTGSFQSSDLLTKFRTFFLRFFLLSHLIAFT